LRLPILRSAGIERDFLSNAQYQLNEGWA